MTRNPRLFVLVPTVLVVALVIAACSTAASDPNPTPRPSATPTVPPTATPPASPAPTKPGHGNVDPEYPELAVELSDGYVVSVTDPLAKAWRIEVRGTGIKAADRIEVVVEVGDVAPSAEARFYVRGALVDVLSFNGLIGVETAAAGGCHSTLDLCVSSGTIAIDPEAGRLSAAFDALSSVGVEIQGASADWPGEPFILGPWRTTEPFIGA